MESTVVVDGRVEDRPTARLLVETGSTVTISSGRTCGKMSADTTGIWRLYYTTSCGSQRRGIAVDWTVCSVTTGWRSLCFSHCSGGQRSYTRMYTWSRFLALHGCVIDLQKRVLLAGGQSVGLISTQVIVHPLRVLYNSCRNSCDPWLSTSTASDASCSSNF